MIHINEVSDNITLALYCYHADRRAPVGPVILNAFVCDFALFVQNLVKYDDDWQEIMTCPDLLRDVVSRLAFEKDDSEGKECEYELPSYLREDS